MDEFIAQYPTAKKNKSMKRKLKFYSQDELQ